MARLIPLPLPTNADIAEAQAKVADLQAQLDAAKAALARIEASIPLGKLTRTPAPDPKPKKK